MIAAFILINSGTCVYTNASRMSTTRRNFLRRMAIGTGAFAAGLPSFAKVAGATDEQMDRSTVLESNGQRFNMCGYAAPKIETVRIGIVGLGMRGSDAVERLSYIDGLEIVALCDKYPDRVIASQKILEKMGRSKAKEYSGEEGWKALCESNNIDLVYSTTPWHLHTPVSVYAMKNGKHAATEVPAGKTIDELWELVEN